MTTSQPRRFHLQRDEDVTGVSGTGRVADGVRWPDGTVTLRWRGDRPSTVHWDRIADAEAVHGHGGATRIVWDDPVVHAGGNAEDCPACAGTNPPYPFICPGPADETAATETVAAALSPAERTMLDYALDQAQERIWSEDGFTNEDQAAVDSLRRLTSEHPAAGARQDGAQR